MGVGGNACPLLGKESTMTSRIDLYSRVTDAIVGENSFANYQKAGVRVPDATGNKFFYNRGPTPNSIYSQEVK